MWNVNGDGLLKLSGAYFVVSMHQYMTHTLNVVPIHLAVAGAVLQCQCVNRLADYFHMCYQSEVHHGDGLRLLQRVVFHIVGKHIRCIEDMAQTFDVSNFFSHI